MSRTLALALLLGLAAGSAQAAERIARIAVDGLWCPSCGYIAAQALTSVPSVEILEREQSKDRRSAIFSVRFDDDDTTPEAIAASVAMYGFAGTALEEGY